MRVVFTLLLTASAAMADAGWEYQVSAVKGPYFLCDERVVEDRWMLDRVSPALRKHPANPIITKAFPWEGNGVFPSVVLRDSTSGLYVMWYQVWNADRYYAKQPFSYNVGYAESKDGVNWERPALRVFDRLPEDPRNNLIKLGREKTQNIDVEINPKPGEIPGRFIALHNERGGLIVSTSEDGKTFTPLHNTPTIPYHSDTANNLVYDERRDRWLIYCRPRAYAGDHKRRVSVQVSKDLKNWTHERTILIPDEDEVQEFYGMTVFRRGDLFFGMAQVYDRVTGFMHDEIAWSGDGVRWSQVGTHPATLPRGDEAAWDSKMVIAASGPVARGDELWFYYSGSGDPHGGAKETTQGSGEKAEKQRPKIQTVSAGLAIADRDRLVGVRPREAGPGYLLTRPFAPPRGKDLMLNVTMDNPGAGRVRVELRDDFGHPIPGYTADDFSPITESGFERVGRWKGRSLGEVQVAEVRLRIEIEDATVYAYDFQPRW